MLLTIPGWCGEKVDRITLRRPEGVRTFYLYAPAGTEPRPLVILLHGSGRNGRVMTDAWQDLATKEHLILAAPDALNPAAWRLDTDGPDFFKQLLAEVGSRRSMDPTRVYLFGHSAGAEFALMLALLESRYFAAVAVHAGGLQPENAALLEYAQRRIPITLWIGDRDQLIPLDHVKQTQAMLEERGFPVTLMVMKGHDHNYYAVAKKVNQEAWTFFAAIRTEQPVYEDYAAPTQ